MLFKDEAGRCGFPGSLLARSQPRQSVKGKSTFLVQSSIYTSATPTLSDNFSTSSHSNNGISSLRTCQLVQAGFEPGSHSCMQSRRGHPVKGPISNLFMVQGVPILEGISGGSDSTVDILVKASIFLRTSLAEITVPMATKTGATIRTACGGVSNCSDDPFQGHHDLLEPSSVPMPHISR